MEDFEIEQLTEKRDNIGNDLLQAWNEYQEKHFNNEWNTCDNADEVLNLAYNLRDNGSRDFLICWDNEIREYEDLDNDLFYQEFLTKD